MSTVIAPSRQATRPGRARRAERRAERRRLRRHDALSRQLAELHAAGQLLEQAAEVVGHGWLQGAWFTVDTDDGTKAVTAYNLRLADTHPVAAACLVGSIVHAAGGPATAGSPLVQHTLDLTWHVLREDSERAIGRHPAPRTRMMRVLDLTHWNDAPGRTQGEVVDLLRNTRQAAGVQRERCLAERSALAHADAG
jgi:hypothetical protein